MLLEKQKFIDTDNHEVARRSIITEFGAARFDIVSARDSFYINGSSVRLHDVDLLRSFSTSAIETAFPEANFFRQYFVLRGSSHLDVEGSPGFDVSSNVSAIVDPERKLCVHTAVNLDHLILRIHQDALKRKLGALLNIHVDRAPSLQGGNNQQSAMARRMRQAVVGFALEVNSFGANLSEIVKTELEQSIVARFLFCNYHEYTARLLAPAPGLSSSQLRFVEEYIEANWDRPLDIEALVAISNLSARSIYRHFKKAKNCSPLEFVKAIRLDRARSQLLSGQDDISVMRVSLACGFQSFGHFAEGYRQAFGELPSITLRRARSHK